jgi:hypothetical protein
MAAVAPRRIGHELAARQSDKAMFDSDIAKADQAIETGRQRCPQPMLSVDVRGDDGPGKALVLLPGNSGAKHCRNVKAVFDPAPPSILDISTGSDREPLRRPRSGMPLLLGAGNH